MIPELVQNEQPSPISDKWYNDELRTLCYQMLSKVPSERPSAEQMTSLPLISAKIAELQRPKSVIARTKSERRAPALEADDDQVAVGTDRLEKKLQRPVSKYSQQLLNEQFGDGDEAPPSTPMTGTASPDQGMVMSEATRTVYNRDSGTGYKPCKQDKKVKAVKGSKAESKISKTPVKSQTKSSGQFKVKTGNAKLNKANTALSLNKREKTIREKTITEGMILQRDISPPKITYTDGDLSQAVDNGDIEKLTSLLKATNVNIHEKIDDNSGDPPSKISIMHRVVDTGRVDLAIVLLQAGADLEAKTFPDGETPLFRACVTCQLGMVQMLLDRGADANVQTNHLTDEADEQTTPLFASVTFGHVPVVRLLLQSGKTSPDERNKFGQTPLHVAAKYGDTDAARTLLQFSADVDAADDVNGATALHRACAYDNVDMARLLLQHGANVEPYTTTTGKVPLHWACEKGNSLIVLLLLEHGANVNVHMKCKPQATALHLASSCGYLNVMRLLLERGANVDDVDSWARTPLFYAIEEGQLEATRFLLQHGASVRVRNTKQNASMMHMAVVGGNLKMVDLILSCGGDLDATTKRGRTPLHWACESGNIEIVERLILNGAKLNFRDFESDATPLFDACWFGNCSVVQLLLDHGSKVNEKAAFGLTPLHAAAEAGSVATIECLLKNGAKINSADVHKETALHRAVSFLRVDAVLALVAHGSNVELRTKFGMTPRDIAEQILNELEEERDDLDESRHVEDNDNLQNSYKISVNSILTTLKKT